MANVYVKPREGGRVRMPDRNYSVMPEKGDWVDADDMFYQRLLIGGDIVRAEPPKPAPAKAVPAATAEAAKAPEDAPKKG